MVYRRRRLDNRNMEVSPYKESKYKVHPYFFALTISFHVLVISRFKKKMVWVRCGGDRLHTSESEVYRYQILTLQVVTVTGRTVIPLFFTITPSLLFNASWSPSGSVP